MARNAHKSESLTTTSQVDADSLNGSKALAPIYSDRAEMAERLRVAAARIERERALGYRPISKRARADFLGGLMSGLTVELACDVAGIAARSVYRLRDKDAEFAQEWADALEASVGTLERRLEYIALTGSVDSMSTVQAAKTLLMGRSRRYSPSPAGQRASATLKQGGDGGGSLTVSLGGPSPD